ASKPPSSTQDRQRRLGPLLSLNVQKAATGLQISWDATSPAVRNADLGILWISDGGQRVRRDLSSKDLSSGTVEYTPASPDVSFQLQVFTLTEQATTGAVRPPAPSVFPGETQVSQIRPPDDTAPQSQPIPAEQPHGADRTENQPVSAVKS